jgi:hypothetical protein
MNMSKGKKSAFFRHIFANNLFGAFFQNFFNRFEIIVNFCVFDTFFDCFFKKKFFYVLLVLFSTFDCKCAGNGSRKRKIFFMNVS